MEKINRRQIKGQIEQQVGQVRESLLQSLGVIEIDKNEHEDVMQVSTKIRMKTGMSTIYHRYGRPFEFELNGNIYQIIDGYLANTQDWNMEIAECLAKLEWVVMTDAHWEVIDFLREYFEEYWSVPTGKIFVKIIAKKLGPEKGNEEYLYELFPDGATQAIKIAGFPQSHGD